MGRRWRRRRSAHTEKGVGREKEGQAGRQAGRLTCCSICVRPPLTNTHDATRLSSSRIIIQPKMRLNANTD